MKKQNTLSCSRIFSFQKIIYSHYQKHGRYFPWRCTRSPYRILVSEMMLQQTQVVRVIPKYRKFITTFPNFSSLARARLNEVLTIWSGLGYNRRALALKKISHIVCNDWGGKLPKDFEKLKTLPGIGEATASSLLAFTWNKPVIFIETNIRSAFIHHFFPKKKNVQDKKIISLVEQTLDKSNSREWYYALMDYGVMLKTKYGNPNTRSAHYAKQTPFKGSHRQIRGGILKILTKNKFLSELEIIKKTDFKPLSVKATLGELKREGFVVLKKDRLTLASHL